MKSIRHAGWALAILFAIVGCKPAAPQYLGHWKATLTDPSSNMEMTNLYRFNADGTAENETHITGMLGMDTHSHGHYTVDGDRITYTCATSTVAIDPSKMGLDPATVAELRRGAPGVPAIMPIGGEKVRDFETIDFTYNVTGSTMTLTGPDGVAKIYDKIH